MSAPSRAGHAESARVRGWKLGEAKTRFSEVVRFAAAGQSQRVTAETPWWLWRRTNSTAFGRVRAATSLHELLSRSPLSRLDFGGGSVRSPIREVDL